MNNRFDVIIQEAEKPPIVNFQPPKIYLCGFPKSGLHLAENMAAGMLSVWSPNGVKGWFGTNAWTTERHYLEQIGKVLATLKPGQYMKGHMGYLTALEAILAGLKIGMVLVYRDFRDVAVSQMYHVLSDSDALNHPDKAHYQKMDSKEEVLKAVIAGDDKYPGLFERWETYAPWLDVEWVLPIRFRNMVNQKKATANRFFDYALSVSRGTYGGDFDLLNSALRETIIDNMVFGMQQKTTTFRKGKTGTWRDEFTDDVLDCYWKYENGWTERLGFSKD